MKIRLAKPTDQRALLTLVEEYYRFDSIKFDSRKAGRALSRLLRNESLGRAWVIDVGGALAGYAILAYNYDLEFGGQEGIITDFFIDSRCRRQGLGARMLSAVCDFCKKARISTVELQVTRTNRRAREFWASQGFAPLDRIVMSRDLIP